MGIAARNIRPRFEESDFDDIEDYPQFAHIAGGPNLPTVEFKVEDIADSASPEDIIRAAIEERVVETRLSDDISFGAVVVPSENSLHGYKFALSQIDNNIRFSAAAYSIFDGIIVRECGVDAGGNSLHPAFNSRFEGYSYYSPLRRNIAILRNYLMVTYAPAKNKFHPTVLEAMAERLGKALSGETQKLSFLQRILWMLKRLFMGPSKPEMNRFLALSNTPDRGIAFMYRYLCGQVALPSFTALLPGAQMPKDWKLLPLETTPFSGENMARFSDGARMGQIAAAFDIVARHLNSVDDMTPKDKEISVDHARDILKNLRIIMTGALEEKQYDEMDPRCREAQSMLHAALGFQGALAELAKTDPDVLNDPMIMEASKSIVKLSSRVRSEEKSMAKQENRAETTTQPQTQQPSSKSGKSKSRPEKHKGAETANKLMFKFEEGATRVGELRRTHRERAKQRSSSLSQAIGGQEKLQKNLNDGMSTISGPKIHQVSLNDAEFVNQVKKLNEKQAEEAQVTNSGNQNLGRK